MNNEREKLYLSKEVIEDLYDKRILTRDYANPKGYLLDGDRLVIHVKEQFKVEITPAKAVKPEGVGKWIAEWRALFPKSVNRGTGLAYRGDKQMCLKNMIWFMREYDYTKEEIFTATQKAVLKAEQDNYAYFPAAHYIIKKQGAGSRLAQFCEMLRDGEDEEIGNYGFTAI